MTDAPERIWVDPSFIPDAAKMIYLTEYVRADFSPAWQPIETAPKDGTKFVFLRILKGVADNFMYFTDIGWFEGLELCVPFDGYGSEPDEMWPTHWMPLPTSPEGAADA